mgnify:CR=1 FL=1
MRLTKDEFVKAVNTVEGLWRADTRIMDLLDVAPECDLFRATTEYYEFLRALCEEKENYAYGTELDYYCWELNFGECAPSDYPSTPEELYDWIVSGEKLI